MHRVSRWGMDRSAATRASWYALVGGHFFVRLMWVHGFRGVYKKVQNFQTETFSCEVRYSDEKIHLHVRFWIALVSYTGAFCCCQTRNVFGCFFLPVSCAQERQTSICETGADECALTCSRGHTAIQLARFLLLVVFVCLLFALHLTYHIGFPTSLLHRKNSPNRWSSTTSQSDAVFSSVGRSEACSVFGDAIKGGRRYYELHYRSFDRTKRAAFKGGK